MPFENWLAFAAAAAIVLVIPGPTILLVISYALGHGRKPAAAIVAGVALGDLTAMTASMVGLGAILAASAELFTVLRWIGAAYLIYLGIKLWRAPVAQQGSLEAPSLGLARIFTHAYAVTALNPKSLVFFVAFVPQFLSSQVAFLPQVTVMVATFVVMAALNAALYGFLASSARGALRSPAVQRTVNRTGGGLLIGAGLTAALWRKSAA